MKGGVEYGDIYLSKYKAKLWNRWRTLSRDIQKFFEFQKRFVLIGAMTMLDE